MVKVVYFNQWFSSISDVIRDLKNKFGESIKIIGSSKNPDHAYKNDVDVFLVEDWKEGKTHEETMQNYLEYSLNVCKTYKVDVFFVRKNMEYLTHHRSAYTENGVSLICENSDIVDLFQKKSSVYDIIKDDETLKDIVPSYYNGSDSKFIIDNIINKHSDINETPWCFKLNCDEGGGSFRAIEQKKLDFKSLYKFRTNSVSKSEALDLISECQDKLDKIIFMELLDGPEISVDCYNSKKGFIVICRNKVSGTRTQKIYYNKELSDICKKLCDTFNLRFPFNVQFRVKHGGDASNVKDLRLLEINTRLSGGLYYEVLSGLNTCHVCLCDTLNKDDGYDINEYINFKDMKVTHVEKAIKL